MLQKLIIRFSTCILVTCPLLLATTARSAQAHHKAAPQTQSLASRIFTSVKPAIVKIETDTKEGTGFRIKDNTTVVTCYHVIQGATSITVDDGLGKRNVLTVTVAKSDDLAILTIGPSPNPYADIPFTKGLLSFLPLTTRSPKIGEQIFVVGNPLGTFTNSLSEGIVSNLWSTDPAQTSEEPTQGGHPVPTLQVTAPISPGSSGSPVIDSLGKVLGVIDSTIPGGQSINLAISSREVKSLLNATPRTVGSFLASEASSPQVEADTHSTELPGTQPDLATAKPKLNSMFAALIGTMSENLWRWYADTLETARANSIPSARMDVAVASSKRFGDGINLNELNPLLGQVDPDACMYPGDSKPMSQALLTIWNVQDERCLHELDLDAADASSQIALAKKVETDNGRLQLAINDLYTLGTKRAWFDWSMFSESMTAPQYYVVFGPSWLDILPDWSFPNRCLVGTILSAQGSPFQYGDEITGVREVSESTYSSISSWKDLVIWCSAHRDTREIAFKAMRNASEIQFQVSAHLS